MDRISKYSRILGYIRLEAVFWFLGLAYLAAIDPFSAGHFSFCPLDNLGLDFCPGCGLGRSISLIFQGDLSGSLAAHPLGIPALIILLSRIVTITYRTRAISKIAVTGGNHG
ncbi:MAG: DUF2752 domain-containing protein [Candidatus Zixiibacteriota bacterium]|nr:MAG: DUF2752 domain-containing protein [candidate division Zixibacteria bacterium]